MEERISQGVGFVNYLISYVNFREAPDLLKRQQLPFFWRACRSNNNVVTNFLYNNPGSLWKKVEPVSRKLIMILSYMD